MYLHVHRVYLWILVWIHKDPCEYAYRNNDLMNFIMMRMTLILNIDTIRENIIWIRILVLLSLIKGVIVQ